MDNPEKAPQWLTTTLAARRLGISRHALYRLIDTGRIPAYRFGRLIRLLVADVEAYRTGESGPPPPS